MTDPFPPTLRSVRPSSTFLRLMFLVPSLLQQGLSLLQQVRHSCSRSVTPAAGFVTPAAGSAPEGFFFLCLFYLIHYISCYCVREA